MKFTTFSIERIPRILFGEGQLKTVPKLISHYGDRVLLVTGGQSFLTSDYRRAFLEELKNSRIVWREVRVQGEPSPTLVDEVVTEHFGSGIHAVIGIGGGSVLDAAKAIAGLLPHGNSVIDHLEDVGRGVSYTGPSLPLIAVPTTAGTGSEATRNAVLGTPGPEGFKKSFRHPLLVPEVAVVDPLLYSSCPPQVTAACGMDALTQLLESYVSTQANPFTDALAESGMRAVKEGFFAAVEGRGDAAQGCAAMAYAALLSGITLAHAGLGVVHGLASPLGTLFPIPHGVACGTVLPAATRVTLQALEQRLPESVALGKYAAVGRLLGEACDADTKGACDLLVELLSAWVKRLKLPGLNAYGVEERHFPQLIAAGGMKNNPVTLTESEVETILRASL